MLAQRLFGDPDYLMRGHQDLPAFQNSMMTSSKAMPGCSIALDAE